MTRARIPFNKAARALIVLIVLVMGGSVTPTGAAEADLEEAKERAAERYPILVKLKEAGKVGEIYTGYIGVVKDQYRDDKAKPDAADSPTVGELVSAENTYRKTVYQRIAEKVNVDAEKVGRRKAQENFKRAGPDVFLKLPDRDWTQKKDLKN